MENINVSVRFKPIPSVSHPKEDPIIILDTSSGVIGLESHQFIFDRVFSGDSSQPEIFDSIAKNAVEWVSQGYNSTIFVYGSTSTGKSYTMFGNENGNKEERGIIPRSCELLFQIINNNDSVLEANMKCSFAEIYCENIRDLMVVNNGTLGSGVANSGVASLKLRQDTNKGVYIQGITEKFVYSSQDILSIIKIGMESRMTASTNLNNVSSRSHAVLSLTLTQKISDGTETISKLHMIDLAGSENVGKSEVQGINLIEAQMINKSLSCLGNVIYALTEKNRDHIPYRDSKLTYLLQDSLGGNSKTILIATASLLPYFHSETLNTLKFARRAKEIKNIPKVNRNESNSNLLKTIEILNKKIEDLENRLEEATYVIKAVETQKDDPISPRVSPETVLLKSKCEILENKVEKLYKEIEKQESRIDQIKEIFEKQRELAKELARKLYQEKMTSCKFSNELEEYKMVYESMKESIKSPHILEMIVNRVSYTRGVREPDRELLEDVEVDSENGLP